MSFLQKFITLLIAVFLVGCSSFTSREITQGSIEYTLTEEVAGSPEIRTTYSYPLSGTTSFDHHIKDDRGVQGERSYATLVESDETSFTLVNDETGEQCARDFCPSLSFIHYTQNDPEPEVSLTELRSSTLYVSGSYGMFIHIEPQQVSSTKSIEGFISLEW